MQLKPAASLASLLLPCLALAQAVDSGTCKQTPQGLAANKQLLRDFFAARGPLEARAERFFTMDYIQHNPRLLRLDAITGATGRKAWVEGFKEALRRRIDFTDLGGIELDQPIVVMAECDLVTAIYRGVLPDPDRPGETYEAFAFEMFRVREGKFSEHWDPVMLKPGWMQPPPAPPPASTSSGTR